MTEIIRNIRDIDTADRKALEYVVGRELRDNQQVVISVLNLKVAPPVQKADQPEPGSLPDWCNVYEGLTDDEIDEIEKSIVRSPGSRTFG